MNDDGKRLSLFEFSKRENDMQHVSYKDEMQAFMYLKEGDPRGSELINQMLLDEVYGTICPDSVQNLKYVCICGIAIAIRIAIEAGVEEQFAYSISDFYASQIHLSSEKPEIRRIYIDMFSLLTHEVRKLKEQDIRCSGLVRKAMSYIYNHAHEIIRISRIADQLQVNETYLSTVFKKETGMTILSYIEQKKIEIAQDLLKYSDFQLIDISNYLAFSSQSSFNRTFKKVTGITPRQYRLQQFSKTL